MQMKQGAKDEWRKRFAVRPDWNQDGKYVEYTVPEGGLPVWRGKAASQEVGEHHQLAGGHEQFYFQPVRDSYAGDPKLNPDQRITFTDQKGLPVKKKLSNKINDPHIKGPFDTGWGYDTIYPTVTGKVGLPLPPEQ